MTHRLDLHVIEGIQLVQYVALLLRRFAPFQIQITRNVQSFCFSLLHNTMLVLKRFYKRKLFKTNCNAIRATITNRAMLYLEIVPELTHASS